MMNEIEKFIPFTNDFMFSLVMKNEELCMEFLKLILPDEDFSQIKIVEPKIEELEGTINTQSFLKFAEIAKGVRFDVYMSSEKVWAEIEMQVYKDYTLPKRSRYYQANMDIDALNKGKDYDELPRCYVIFVCTYDFVGKDCPVYYFENTEKNLGLPFGDETCKIILNTKCSPEKIPEKLKPLYKYINNPKTKNSDGFVKKLDEQVKKYNDSEWRHKFMTFEESIRMRCKVVRQEGWDAGKQEGWNAGRQEGWDAGKQEGWNAGRQEGWDAGKQEGWNAGRQEGWDAGKQEGWNAGRQEGWDAGKQEGWNAGIEKIAGKMKESGIPLEEIVKFTGLLEEEIEAL